jgi:hypothetical protein
MPTQALAQGDAPAAQAGLASPQPLPALGAAPTIDPPDDASARSAFAYARAAIAHSARALRGGDDPSPQAADIAPPEGLYPGACVTIREAGGRLLGRGVFVGGVRSVEFATQRALEQALQALPQARDMLQRAVAADTLASALLTVELSGQPTPLRPERFAELDHELDMGIDGVLAIAPTRDGDQMHAVFPLGMLVQGSPPSRAMVSAVSVASGDPSMAIAGVRPHEAAAVREKGVQLFRLRARQLAQLSSQPDLDRAPEPMMLTRGSRLARVSELSTPALRDLLARTTDHVVRRATTGASLGQDVALWDDLRPLEGVQQGFADGGSKAVASLALLHASSTLMEGNHRELALRAARLSERLLVQQLAGDGLFGDGLSADAGPGVLADDSTQSAAWLAALLVGAEHEEVGPSLRSQPWFTERVAELGASVQRGLRRDERGAAVGFADGVPEGGRGVIAYALAKLSVQPGADAALVQLRRDALAQTYLGAGPGELAGQLPWLWWAESAASDGVAGLPPALLELREHIWQNQVREGDQPDVLGGIILREQLSPTGKALPTWQGLRPVAFVAASLRDPRLTPVGERMAELSKLLGSLRFARQLVVDESAAWAGGLERPGGVQDIAAGGAAGATAEAAPGPTMLWGVRAAPWDYRMPLDACVAGVLALSEAVRSLEVLAGQPQSQPESQPESQTQSQPAGSPGEPSGPR